MSSKFHWGHGITIFYIIFVCLIITALVASFGVDHSLVTEDYYAKDIAYQQQYDKKQNLLKNNNKDLSVELNNSNKTLSISSPSKEKIKGIINFYRPSDKNQDFAVDLESNQVTFSTAELAKGKWILKIEWKEGDVPYYVERQIFIP